MGPMQISEVFYAPKDTWLGTASLYPEKPAVIAVSEISIRYRETGAPTAQ